MHTLLAALALTVGSTLSPSAAQDDASLVGTWRLERLMNVADEKQTHPFGSRPLGYFVYTADGRVMIQIQQETPPRTWRSLDTTAGGFGANAPWYVGYFGRYTLDADAGVIIHHVEGGTVLSYIGTDQRRPFVLDGDRLFIGERGSWERELVRVKQ